MKLLRKFWTVLPFFLLTLTGTAVLYMENYGLVIRSLPGEILFLLWAASLLLLMGGGGVGLWRRLRGKSRALRMLAAGADIALCLAGIVFAYCTLFTAAFAYEPEHEVERDGVKIVACVSSWLDVNVSYYEYRGPLFRGSERLIEEWYGSGGYDPFTVEWDAVPIGTVYN